jgi:hypothetical protein
MMYVSSIEDLIEELDSLRSYGVTVSEAAYVAARSADIRLLSSLDRRDAALLVLRRASSMPVRSANSP